MLNVCLLVALHASQQINSMLLQDTKHYLLTNHLNFGKTMVNKHWNIINNVIVTLDYIKCSTRRNKYAYKLIKNQLIATFYAGYLMKYFTFFIF